MIKKSWNSVLNLVSQIKDEYLKTYNIISYEISPLAVYVDEKFSHSTTITCLEKWIRDLNNTLYLNWLKPLQITQYGTLILIRYALIDMYQQDMSGDMWEWYGGIYKECRSVVIDLNTMELVVAPFKKFFNVNEREDSKIEIIKEKIKTAKIIEFSDKLDGSMQSASYYNDEIVMFGSQALDKEKSWRLTDGYNWLMSKPDYVKLIQRFPHFTFIFEWISLKDAHVVNYTKEQEGLYLIGIRIKDSGRLYTHDEIRLLVEKNNCKILLPNYLQGDNLDICLDETKTAKSHVKEGWVIRIDNNMYKLKVDDYVSVHRILGDISSINLIIKNIADGIFDDLISKIPDAYKNRVEKVSNLVFNYIKEMGNEVERLYNLNYNEDRKTFMISIQQCDKKYRGYLTNKYLGNEINFVKSSSGSYKKLKDMGIDMEYSAIFFNEE